MKGRQIRRNGLIVCVENNIQLLKSSALELLNEFHKVAENKINTQKSIVCLSIGSELTENVRHVML